MPEQMTIPISFFEYGADFKVPIMRLWMDRADIVQALFQALEPWNVLLDNVESVTTGKPSEQGVNIKLPLQRATFFFGPAGCKFTKEAADWASAEEIIKLVYTARGALLSASGAVVGAQRTAIALHAQMKNKQFIEVLRPFLPAAILGLHDERVTTAATITKWEKSKLILDGSGSVANAVFIRLEREFGATAGFEEISGELRKDEEAVFRLLDIEEVTS
jgi:hypothetical protein